MGGQALRTAWVSGAYIIAVETTKRRRSLDVVLELSRESKDQGSHAWLLRNLGDLTARHVPLDLEQAEANYGAALGLAQQLGMRPLQAHCHLGLGDVHAR